MIGRDPNPYRKENPPKKGSGSWGKDLDWNRHTAGRGSTVWRVPDLWKAAARKKVKTADPAFFFQDFSTQRWGSPSEVERELDFHADRILHADMKYPIIVDTECHIIDGFHRMLRAYMEGHKNIKYVVLDPYTVAPIS